MVLFLPIPWETFPIKNKKTNLFKCFFSKKNFSKIKIFEKIEWLFIKLDMTNTNHRGAKLSFSDKTFVNVIMDGLPIPSTTRVNSERFHIELGRNFGDSSNILSEEISGTPRIFSRKKFPGLVEYSLGRNFRDS